MTHDWVWHEDFVIWNDLSLWDSSLTQQILVARQKDNTANTAMQQGVIFTVAPVTVNFWYVLFTSDLAREWVLWPCQELHPKKLKPKNEKNTHADSDDVNEKLWMFQTDPSTEGKPWFFVPDEVAPKLNALLDPNCPDEGFEIWLPTNMFRNTHFNFDVLQQQKQKKWVLMANENQTRTSRRTAVLQVADQKLRQRGFKLMTTFRWQDSRGTFECYRLTAYRLRA